MTAAAVAIAKRSVTDSLSSSLTMSACVSSYNIHFVCLYFWLSALFTLYLSFKFLFLLHVLFMFRYTSFFFTYSLCASSYFWSPVSSYFFYLFLHFILSSSCISVSVPRASSLPCLQPASRPVTFQPHLIKALLNIRSVNTVGSGKL